MEHQIINNTRKRIVYYAFSKLFCGLPTNIRYAYNTLVECVCFAIDKNGEINLTEDIYPYTSNYISNRSTSHTCNMILTYLPVFKYGGEDSIWNDKKVYGQGLATITARQFIYRVSKYIKRNYSELETASENFDYSNWEMTQREKELSPVIEYVLSKLGLDKSCESKYYLFTLISFYLSDDDYLQYIKTTDYDFYEDVNMLFLGKYDDRNSNLHHELVGKLNNFLRRNYEDRMNIQSSYDHSGEEVYSFWNEIIPYSVDTPHPKILIKRIVMYIADNYEKLKLEIENR